MRRDRSATPPDDSWTGEQVLSVVVPDSTINSSTKHLLKLFKSPFKDVGFQEEIVFSLRLQVACIFHIFSFVPPRGPRSYALYFWRDSFPGCYAWLTVFGFRGWLYLWRNLLPVAPSCSQCLLSRAATGFRSLWWLEWKGPFVSWVIHNFPSNFFQNLLLSRIFAVDKQRVHSNILLDPLHYLTLLNDYAVLQSAHQRAAWPSMYLPCHTIIVMSEIEHSYCLSTLLSTLYSMWYTVSRRPRSYYLTTILLVNIYTRLCVWLWSLCIWR